MGDDLKQLAIILFTAGGMLLNAQSTALAQSDSNLAINVSARVISSIELLTLRSIKLSEAEAENDVIRIAPLSSTHAGKMIAIGTPDSDIRISFLESREMARVDGTENLTFNYKIAGNTEDDQATAEVLDQENRDFEFNGDGRFYLWIGGDVDVSTASPGNYQGEFTLEIEYI